MLAHGPFLERLREQGRVCGQAWAAENTAAVGRRATVDLKRWFG
jgi:hypothetical protein